MIVFDTETTGLPQQGKPLAEQPEIIEFCAVKLSDIDLMELGRIDFLVKPMTPVLSPKITKITGLTIDDLANEKSWARMVPTVQAFFLGQDTCVAHNCAFDIAMMTLEQDRLNRTNRFPWPVNQLCTVEASLSLKGHRLKLSELYEHAFGETFPNAHRARNDVNALVRVVRWMREQDLL